MKRVNLKSIFVLSTLLFGYLLLAKGSPAYCPPYFAFVDKANSDFPSCVKIDGGMFCGGSLEVKNTCASDLILENINIPVGETEYSDFDVVRWETDSSTDKKQNWVLKGKVGATPVLVKGYTEDWSGKNPLEYTVKAVPLSIKTAILLFILGALIMIFAIKKTRR